MTRRVVAASVVALALLGVACAGPPVHASRAAGAAHPRIFLDPSTLSTLRTRAAAGTIEWTTLKSRCDEYLTGTVSWPDGNDYPDGGSIGEGYQGDGYFAPLLNVGLCYQIALSLDPAQAAAYGAKGADVLTKMTAPSGGHAPNPLRDSGYGIRFYGLGMAIGFDWLYDALTPALRSRVVTAFNRWVDAFESGGFERDFPQGNYFAGYFAAKGIGALATEDDNPRAPAMWSDWLDRLYGQLVKPYYAANLAGGGWPEGWNYGPLASANMVWPILAAQTAKGLDLLTGDPFARAQPRFLLYFTWPSLKTMEDSDAQYDGDNPSATQPWLVGLEAGLLERWRDPFAGFFHRFARAIRHAQPAGQLGPDWDLWQDFLFWDPKGRENDYHHLPLSYVARGVEMVAVRSSWQQDAVWASFKGGPYVNNPDNGEQYFDEGSLVILDGARQLLVNGPGALLCNTPGTNDGSQFYNPIYDDIFGDGSPRDLFNVLYTDRPTPTGQGNNLRSDGARTSITRFDDAGGYVALRASHLEDDYPRNPGTAKTIQSWTREVVYLRPSVFVVFDRTKVTAPDVERWLAWHLAKKPVADGSAGRFSVGSGASYAGEVQTVLPAGRDDRIVDVFGGHKIYRLETHVGPAPRTTRWVTVFDAAASPSAAVVASPLEHATSNVVGTVLREATRNDVVAAGSGEAVSGDIRYDVPAGFARHVITDVAPSSSFGVTTSSAGGVVTVTIHPGGTDVTSSPAGVLQFTTS